MVRNLALITHSKPCISKPCQKATNATLKSLNIARMTQTKLLEQSFCKVSNKPFCKAYPSLTSALSELIIALGLNKNDQVLMPAYICSSVKTAVSPFAECVFYDNAKFSWISSFEQIKTKITPKTKAIIINHTFGIKFSHKDIQKLGKLGIFLIQDCAHRIENTKEDKNTSDLFNASLYSFNATKLIAAGEGGLIAVDDKNIFKSLRTMGFCDLQASLALCQLKKYPKFLEKRLKIAHNYKQNLQDLIEFKERDSIYFRFVFFTYLQKEFLATKKIHFRLGVDALLKTLPNAKYAINHTISVPIYPSLSKKEQEIIITKIRSIYENNKTY